MNRYFVSELYPAARYTAGVLREDIETTLAAIGYQKLRTPLPRNFLGRLIAYPQAGAIAKRLPAGSTVFFHFPLRSGINHYLIACLKQRNITTIGYIHDFEGLRDQSEAILVEELDQLRQFDCIIAQNQTMKEFVAEKTNHPKIVVLEMYDYLDTIAPVNKPLKQGAVIFAGNLEKAPFITQLESLSPLRFTVYGEPVPANNANNIVFKGNADPRSLPSEIAATGSFGLVWDGSSMQSGKDAGAYLRINTPHKLALYIMAGLPLIVWKESAMADWVQQEQIGITVSNLYDLKEEIDKVSDARYDQFQTKLEALRQKMSEGYFLKGAIQHAEQLLA
jgi:hypothetical protein